MGLAATLEFPAFRGSRLVSEVTAKTIRIATSSPPSSHPGWTPTLFLEPARPAVWSNLMPGANMRFGGPSRLQSWRMARHKAKDEDHIVFTSNLFKRDPVGACALSSRALLCIAFPWIAP